MAIAIKIIKVFPFDLTSLLLGIDPIDMLMYEGNVCTRFFNEKKIFHAALFVN